MSIDLFDNLRGNALFHFGDEPDVICIKVGDDHYVSPSGYHHINPYVAVIPDPVKSGWEDSIYNQEKGYSDGGR